MFTLQGLFKSLRCPDRDTCNRPHCLYSHASNIPPARLPQFIVKAAPPPITQAAQAIPIKRPVVRATSPPTPEPPRKFQKVGTSQRPLAVPFASHSESGVPILRVNAARSQVAVPVRQTMLKTLYDHFVILYEAILSDNPSLASEHALKQEEDVYKLSTKFTYRNAVIQCVAALKRRPIPNSVSHPSVGTEAEVIARAEAQKSLQSLLLSRELLEPLVHSVDELKTWGYFLDIPPGPGGDQPSLEEMTAKCDRCAEYFLVKRMEAAEKCIYHWGKPYYTRVDGERIRIYSCCSRPYDTEGCSHGPHVFYESKVEELHSRHPFSFLAPESSSTSVLDVVALDCEMIYTTGGFRVARVSIVDGSGKEVFDQLVRMDDGVHVIDFNTRFSGITEEKYATALLPLASIRETLNTYLDSNTILIGHALDNDLKTLRILHHKCIDTALLFPHRAGAPYRRALKELVREKLGMTIQAGDATEGHSSIEDASATLDLVRWYILNKQKSAVHSVLKMW